MFIQPPVLARMAVFTRTLHDRKNWRRERLSIKTREYCAVGRPFNLPGQYATPIGEGSRDLGKNLLWGPECHGSRPTQEPAKELKELHQGNSTAGRQITLIVSLSVYISCQPKCPGCGFRPSTHFKNVPVLSRRKHWP